MSTAITATRQSSNTLVAFKAAIKVGTQLTVTDHWLERHRNSVRTVTKVQTNGLWLTHGDDDTRYRSAFPTFDGSTTRITMGEKLWTLRLAVIP